MRGTAQARAFDRDSDFQRCLEERLAHIFGATRIREIRRRPCPYTSSFQIDELDVRFHDGSSVPLLLKDLSRQGMLETARRARPEFLYRPDREINAYRWILPHAPSGTAVWYGAGTAPSAGQFWLFLERVAGLQLSQVGAFSVWKQAAAWIARFHRSFAAAQAHRLVQSANLLVYDEAFYWRWLHRAQTFAARESQRRRSIDRIARSYPAIVTRLTRLPRTIIHGELYACNVLVAGAQPRVRICPVDWEMAALGPNLIDLASLIAGWAERQQRALALAYLRATRPGSSGRTRVTKEFQVDLDCCRLHLAIRMLGWSDNWTPPRQHARNWLAEAVRIADRLQDLT
jgi:hypothetical protein